MEFTHKIEWYETFEPDIITIGLNDNIPKRNCLKGLAMQKLVRYVLKTFQEDISINKIIQLIKDHVEDYYVVEIPFKTQNRSFRYRWQYFDKNDFGTSMKVFVKNQIIDKNWKKCDYCGLTIPADKQYSRKCRKCRKGWFQIITKKFDKWVLAIDNQREIVLDFLERKGYIRKISLRKRIDFFTYSKGKFIVYEAKNKEKSGLSLQDFRRTLVYPIILQNCGYTVNELIILYNGYLDDKLAWLLAQKENQKYIFPISLCPIGKFIKENNFHVQSILVKKQNGKYHYNFISGFSATLFCEQITIDLTNIE